MKAQHNIPVDFFLTNLVDCAVFGKMWVEIFKWLAGLV